MLLMPIQAAIDAGTPGVTAAVEETKKLSEILASKGGEYMRQRADDIRYIGEMLADAISGETSSYVRRRETSPFCLRRTS